MQDEGAGRSYRLFAVGVVVLAVFVLACSLVALDVARVRTDATRARQALVDGLAAVETGDVVAADRLLDTVSRHVDAARQGTSRPGWRVARRLPVAERNLEAAEVTIAAAHEATEVASALLRPIADLAGPDGQVRLRDDQGRVDLDPVGAAARSLETLDTHPLDEALQRLQGLDVDGLVPSIVDGRAEALAQGRRLRDVAADVRVLAGVLPSFLGVEEPREYFLAMQNLAEGRGTGGLIGFFATIRVGEGRIELTRPERYEVLDQVQRTGETPPIAPESLPDGFLERYGQFDPTTFLANANLDPDLPTVAEVLLNLYEAQRGRRLDGVIAMDPVGLAYAHAAIGPVELPEATPRGGLPRSIPPRALARVLMVDAYDELGGPSPQRKAFLAQVARTAFAGVTSTEWSALTMARWLSQAAGSGHLQLYSTHPEEQGAFAELGVAGQLEAPDGQDLLAVTFNNSGGNKMDVHVGHTVRGLVTLTPDGVGGLERTAELEVTVDNPLPTEGRDIYIIGTHKPNLGFVEAFTDEAGLNRTWFTVWAPDTTTDASRTDEDGVVDADPQLQRLHGLVALDHVLDTPSKSTRSFGASVRGPVPVDDTDGGLVYRLRLHRQSKGIPDRIDLRFAAPEGWRVVPVELSSGGQDPLFGVHGAVGPEVVAEAEGRSVRVRGDMTRAIDLTVRLVPGDG